MVNGSTKEEVRERGVKGKQVIGALEGSERKKGYHGGKEGQYVKYHDPLWY